MRRAVCLLLSGALLFGLLTACGKDAGGEASDPPVRTSKRVRETPPAVEEPTALEVVNAVFASCGFENIDPDVEYLTMEEGGYEFLSAYLENAYKLDLPWADAAVIRGVGASAFELAVLRMEDGTAAVRAASALMSYIFARQGDFAGYAPAQADMVANGGIAQSGRYAGLFICPDPDGAEAAFQLMIDGEYTPVRPVESEPVWDSPYDPDFPDRIRFVQPNKDDMSLYDTAAIRTAWEMGDPSGLSGDDRAIYDAAREILDGALEEGTSDLEKETALYSWMVSNVNYDWTHQNFFLSTPRTSFAPYGSLVDHTAVCLGYATGFQLLMDLAGVVHHRGGRGLPKRGGPRLEHGAAGWEMVLRGHDLGCQPAGAAGMGRSEVLELLQRDQRLYGRYQPPVGLCQHPGGHGVGRRLCRAGERPAQLLPVNDKKRRLRAALFAKLVKPMNFANQSEIELSKLHGFRRVFAKK